MKKCLGCGEMKPLDEFYTHPKMSDGHLSKCKSCVKARVGRHRKANLERLRAYDRARAGQPERVEVRKRVADRWKTDPELRVRSQMQKQAWADRNAEKRAAHYAVSNAIRDGKLNRQPCCKCGDDKAHAHHDDYSKPLDVQWLCRKHHAERHKELRALARGEP